MIIQQNQNGLITERKTSFKKKTHILSEKISNETIFNKKNSIKNSNIFKKPYIDIKSNSKKNERYQSQTIISNNQNNRIKLKKNKQNTNSNNLKNLSIINLNAIKKNNYNESIYDNNNESDKENNIDNIPQTSRYDNNSKEKYLSNLFNHIESNYKTIFEKKNNYNIPNKLVKTTNNHSKRYNSTYITPIWKAEFNNIHNDNNNRNSSDIITNESMINLEDQLNYEFEIRLLKKKI